MKKKSDFDNKNACDLIIRMIIKKGKLVRTSTTHAFIACCNNVFLFKAFPIEQCLSECRYTPLVQYENYKIGQCEFDYLWDGECPSTYAQHKFGRWVGWQRRILWAKMFNEVQDEPGK